MPIILFFDIILLIVFFAFFGGISHPVLGRIGIDKHTLRAYRARRFAYDVIGRRVDEGAPRIVEQRRKLLAYALYLY